MTLLAFALGIINLLTAILKIKCFECGKKLRLAIVRNDNTGQRSIECRCCWKIANS